MKLLAVDSNSIMNRAFYGIKLLTTKDGFYTNAVYGFMSMLLSIISEVGPDAAVFAFDVHAPTFRHGMFPEYKAGRHATPPELLAQFPLIKELLADLGYPILEVPGYEADDILGTLARDCEEDGDDCVIATGDRDSLQLITEKTTVRLAATKMGRPETTMMDVPAVAEKYGVAPGQLIDVKALMGDSSDNIPGVPGIGEKTALALISQYGSLNYIYDNLDSLDVRDSVRAKLSAGRDSAFLSRTLGTIVKDAPIPHDVKDYARREPDEGAAALLLSKLEMYKMIERLGLDPAKIPAPAEKRAEKAPPLRFTAVEPEELAGFAAGHDSFGVLADTEGDDVRAVCLVSGEEAALCENTGLGFDGALMRALSGGERKQTDDLKLLSRWAYSRGGKTASFDMDTGLAGYILNVTATDYSAGRLALEYGAEKREPLGAPSGEVCDRAAVFGSLCEKLSEKIEQNGQDFLLREIELPLAGTLAAMELAGFEIDPDGLRGYGEELSAEIEKLEASIYELAGERFNILSPKQLGEVLFEHLGLPTKKKTKSGYATDAKVLEELRGYHPVVDAILDYRKLTKLRSTYVDGLLAALAPDGRVHTRFNQKETRTGRISSLEPNLQNIPIRTELGSRLRGFFRAREGCLLVDADYSQIELRVLAHIANDEKMREAFTEGVDIHRRTASQIFGLPEEFVTPQLRSRAKAVNFGIVYGIGAFSLANNTGVTTAEAKKYIDSYLATYSGVDAYMKRAIEDAKRLGYAETISGRRRALPELASANRNLRAFGERVARNMPIQGAAADIIKLAMVRVEKRLAAEGLSARLIMQVHDELIVEAAEADAEKAAAVLKEEMEGAMKLSVPLVAEVGMGKTWLEAH